MKKYSLLPLIVFSSAACFGQSIPGYVSFIRDDSSIRWAAISDKVINLTPAPGAAHLKNWYLEKLSKGAVTVYTWRDDRGVISSHSLTLPGLVKQDWLKGLTAELPEKRHPKEWYFVDPVIPQNNYERVKYRIGTGRFSTDSCCGCDEADAFRVKQVLTYSNGKFGIYNVFISPLCARQSGPNTGEWFPLCHVAYNSDGNSKIPAVSKDVVLINSDEVEYEFSMENPSHFDSVLTAGRPLIGSLILADLSKGKIRATEISSGRNIPKGKMLTWQMPRDTVMVFDEKDDTKPGRIKVIQKERNPADFSRLRIRQDLYFDFKNERLFSRVRSVIIVVAVRNYDGDIRGYMPFCRLE